MILMGSGCTSTAIKQQHYNVVVNSDRIHFSGKGAAAGMMLSSSLGPMGIAVGIAVDEGVAKEIHQAFEEAEGDLPQFIQTEVNQQCQGLPSAQVSFEFDRIGFRLSSSDERASLFIEGAVVLAGVEERVDGLLTLTDLQNAKVSDLRTKGALVVERIEYGIYLMCTNLSRL